MAIPLLLLGDAPYTTTGLSRILTDLVTRITEAPETAGLFDVGVVGYRPWDHLPTAGVPTTYGHPDGRLTLWKNWLFSDLSHWGRDAISTAYRAWFGDRKGILLSIWDPARCYEAAQVNLPIERWGYFAIDAANLHGQLSGPALKAVQAYDRVLAYSAYGATVLELSGIERVEHLPHGIDLDVFTPQVTEEVRRRAIQTIFPAGYPAEAPMVIGCVATNHARKDLGLYCQVLRLLRGRGHKVHGWLHTDRVVSEAWSIPQLAEDCGLTGALTVTTHEMTNADLAACYSLCVATIAPGRGEGFGYPIVESLACGVPVVHADAGGGAEFTPEGARVRPRLTHLEGPYALQRPILDPGDVANVVRQILALQWSGAQACRASVAPLHWPTLWPRWAEWITRGLAGFIEREVPNVRG